MALKPGQVVGSLQRSVAKALSRSRLNVNVKGLSVLIGPSIFNVPDMAFIAFAACWEPSWSNKTHLRKSIHNPCPHFNYSMAKKSSIEEKERTKETFRQINVI